MELPLEIECNNKYCNIKFKPRSYKSKYCSKGCQIDARRLKEPVTEKYCPMCENIKPANEFNVQKSASCWLSSYCKNCLSIRRKRNRQVVEYICIKCNKVFERIKYSYNKEKIRTETCNLCSKKLILDRNGGKPVNYKGTKYFTGKSFSAWKNSAKRRGHIWDLSKEDLVKIFEKQNGICAISGIPFIMDIKNSPLRPSLDRKNSNNGYTVDNIQFVCSVINIMKNKLLDSEFIKLCEQIVLFQNKKEETNE